MIAPTFEALANKFAKPNRIAFAKVDVDSHRDIAQQYGVRAMPTFVILRNGSVHETLQGANPPALTAAVEKAVKLATGGGSTFSTPGRALGSDAPASSPASIRVGAGATRPSGGPIQGHRSWFDPKRVIQWLISFIGLYLTSLFSVSLERCRYTLLSVTNHLPLTSSTHTWRHRIQNSTSETHPRRLGCRRVLPLADGRFIVVPHYNVV